MSPSGSGALPAVDVVGQLRALFHRQRVEREVLRRQLDRPLERRLPALHRLVRKPVDQVEVDALEAGLARPAVALLRLLGRVDAVERGQLVVVERLDAEADAVDARCDAGRGGSRASTVPGFASSETSASGSRSNDSRSAAMIRSICSIGSSEGVPPPKKTVSTRRSAMRRRPEPHLVAMSASHERSHEVTRCRRRS